MKKINSLKKTVKKFFSHKTYTWIPILIAIVGLAIFFSGKNSAKPSTSSATYTESRSMVKYLKQVEEVVFLDVGIQSIETQTNNTKLFGKLNIPASEKKTIIILNYDTKLGIKKAVNIIEKKNNHYEIRVPKFEFIGINLDEKEPYQLYDEKKGLLSMATKNIDTAALATQKLSAAKQNDYIDKYQERLKESAENYYTSLFASIDPDITLTFTFEE